MKMIHCTTNCEDVLKHVSGKLNRKEVIKTSEVKTNHLREKRSVLRKSGCSRMCQKTNICLLSKWREGEEKEVEASGNSCMFLMKTHRGKSSFLFIRGVSDSGHIAGGSLKTERKTG